MYYQDVIIMVPQNLNNEKSHHKIILQDCCQDAEIPREQTSEDRGYVPFEKRHIPRATRQDRWMTGRSAVTLHR